MNAVLAIERASFGSGAYPESLFRLYAADRRSLFLIARFAQAVVGYIIARSDRWGAEIISIAVHPSLRKRGIGHALLRAIVRHSLEGRALSIRLMVRADNTSAANFYRRSGFRCIGRVPDYYEDGATGIRMRLQLSRNATGGAGAARETIQC
jgi:ribosomal-protein-alanine acetyltransferase